MNNIAALVKLKGGQIISALTGEQLPLSDGSEFEIRIRDIYLTDRNLSRALRLQKKIELLPAGTTLLSFVSVPFADPGIQTKVKVMEPPGKTNAGYVEIVINQPLILHIRPPNLATLIRCDCTVPALMKQTQTLNSAHTRISERFETDRTAHHGNVFRRVFFSATVDGEEVWLPLQQLRRTALEGFRADQGTIIDQF